MFLDWPANNLNFENLNSAQLPVWHMLLVPQSWSLGIEVTFYLLAPLLCKAKSRTIIVSGIILFVIRIIAFTMGLNVDPWTYRFFPFELPMFMLGILLYRLKNYLRFTPKMSIAKTYAYLLFVYLLFPFVTEKFYLGRAPQLIILVMLTSSIILFGPENKKDKKFGDLSYPIYMSHILVISTYSGMLGFISERIIIFEKLKSPITFNLMTLFLTFLFSLLLIHLVRPIERVRDNNRK
jgi:peptidoglycan/LPS O-acetylase OafA/YrhL